MRAMHSDSYFCTGSTHNVCQDYASHGVTKHGRVYATVSDGCSGSPHTDFGSRFVTKAVHCALNRLEPDAPVGESLFYAMDAHSQQMASTCDVDHACLDATMILAVEHRDGVLAMAMGDGVIAARRRGTQHYEVHTIEFFSGYPAYASYSGDYARLVEYAKHTEGGLAHILVQDGGGINNYSYKFPFYPMGAHGVPVINPYSRIFDRESYDLVLVMSDGAAAFYETSTSVTSKHQEQVPLDKMLKEVTDFKSTKGEFVVRRAKKFLNKTCVDNHWMPHDDWSIAAISME